MLAFAGVALLLVLRGDGQQASSLPQSNDPRIKVRSTDASGQFGEVDPVVLRKRMNMLNAQRQKELVSDTVKLLRLAREFNAEVGDGDASKLNGEQLKRLAEIGKLAKSVREKMTFSLGGSSPSVAPFGITP